MYPVGGETAEDSNSSAYTNSSSDSSTPKCKPRAESTEQLSKRASSGSQSSFISSSSESLRDHEQVRRTVTPPLERLDQEDSEIAFPSSQIYRTQGTELSSSTTHPSDENASEKHVGERHHSSIEQMAKFLEIPYWDERYADLLWLAEEALLAPLPPGWNVMTYGTDIRWYWNSADPHTVFDEHPLDQTYFLLARKYMMERELEDKHGIRETTFDSSDESSRRIRSRGIRNQLPLERAVRVQKFYQVHGFVRGKELLLHGLYFGKNIAIVQKLLQPITEEEYAGLSKCFDMEWNWQNKVTHSFIAKAAILPTISPATIISPDSEGSLCLHKSINGTLGVVDDHQHLLEALIHVVDQRGCVKRETQAFVQTFLKILQQSTDIVSTETEFTICSDEALFTMDACELIHLRAILRDIVKALNQYLLYVTQKKEVELQKKHNLDEKIKNVISDTQDIEKSL